MLIESPTEAQVTKPQGIKVQAFLFKKPSSSCTAAVVAPAVSRHVHERAQCKNITDILYGSQQFETSWDHQTLLYT